MTSEVAKYRISDALPELTVFGLYCLQKELQGIFSFPPFSQCLTPQVKDVVAVDAPSVSFEKDIGQGKDRIYDAEPVIGVDGKKISLSAFF